MNTCYISYKGIATESIYLSATDIEVHDSVKITKYPVEKGYTVMDNRVEQPTVIEIKALAEDKNVSAISTLRFLLKKSKDTFDVTCKSATYTNMVLESIKESDKTDMYDVVEVTLKFVEALSYGKVQVPKQADDSDTDLLGLILGLDTSYEFELLTADEAKKAEQFRGV